MDPDDKSNHHTCAQAKYRNSSRRENAIRKVPARGALIPDFATTQSCDSQSPGCTTWRVLKNTKILTPGNNIVSIKPESLRRGSSPKAF